MRLLRLPGVFEPHSDSWLLAHHVRREPLRANATVLDLCTGSGLVGVTAASRKGCHVVAVDISSRAVLATRINARLNGVSLKALRGDLFGPVDGARFDLVASNPPYVPTPDGALPARGPARAWEGGRTGRAFIDRICAEAPRHLNPDGTLLIVHSSVCGESETLAALSRGGLTAEVIARSKGFLGPLLSSRSEWLRGRGLIEDEGLEEMLVVRARRST